MSSGMENTVRTFQLPTPSPAQLFLSQYNLASNTPILVTPGFGGSGAGPLPPIQTGAARSSLQITYYCEQASVEARET